MTAGEVMEIHCTYDPDSKSGTAGADKRKIKGNIHWLSARHAQQAEVRLYDRLFTHAHPDAGGQDYKSFLNPHSKRANDSLRRAVSHAGRTRGSVPV